MTAHEYTERPASSSSTAFENRLAFAMRAGIDRAAPAPTWSGSRDMNNSVTEAITIGFTFLVKSRRPRMGAHVVRLESTGTLAHGMRAPQAIRCCAQRRAFNPQPRDTLDRGQKA